MAFESTNTEYGIVSDREIASVLGNFTPDMVLNIIEDNLVDKMRPYSQNIGNLVASYELNYKASIANYPMCAEDLTLLRERSYESILKRICEFHNLDYEMDPGMDLYTVAFLVYRFLISEYKSNICTFYRNYIMKEKFNIYKAFNLSELKKSKSSSSSYSRIYTGGNPQLSVIHANMDYVITQMCGFDIDLNAIIETVYMGDKNVTRLLQSVLYDRGDFFKQFYVGTITGPDRAEIITNIRLQLQPIASVNIEEYLNDESEDE